MIKFIEKLTHAIKTTILLVENMNSVQEDLFDLMDFMKEENFNTSDGIWQLEVILIKLGLMDQYMCRNNVIFNKEK